MDQIKVCKVPEVTLCIDSMVLVGTLHLTPHHLIFSYPENEKWVTYSLISSVQCLPLSEDYNYELEIRCHHFLYFILSFKTQKDIEEVFESIKTLTCIDSISKVYAFYFQPNQPFTFTKEQGWNIYDPIKEFNRMGVETNNPNWRITNINQDYNFSSTYPKVLVVPSKISDNVLNYAKKYRSKGRLPVLTYLHKNGYSITRSSQPLVGLKQNRSIQDETLISNIFNTKKGDHNLIIDARPQANAMANVAIGAGSEMIEFYQNCTREYMGIENIHVIRESLNKLTEAICSSKGVSIINKIELSKSSWIKHIRLILDSTAKVVNHINNLNSHVLIHCSDGWDRTSQITSLAALCLDPYYRTLKGFITLIEKDWISFGYKFQSRTGHLTKTKNFVNNSNINLNNNNNQTLLSNMQNKFMQITITKPNHDKEFSPIFHQFLDACYQLWIQNPTYFEFNEKFLITLYTSSYSCEYGNFLMDNENQMNSNDIKNKTYSLWSKIFSNEQNYINSIYNQNDVVIIPDTKYLRYWAALFCRKDEDLNYQSPPCIASPRSTPININNNEETITAKFSKLMESGNLSKLVESALGPENRISNMLNSTHTNNNNTEVMDEKEEELEAVNSNDVLNGKGEDTNQIVSPILGSVNSTKSSELSPSNNAKYLTSSIPEFDNSSKPVSPPSAHNVNKIIDSPPNSNNSRPILSPPTSNKNKDNSSPSIDSTSVTIRSSSLNTTNVNSIQPIFELEINNKEESKKIDKNKELDIKNLNHSNISHPLSSIP